LNQWLLIVHDHLASMSDRTRLNRSAFDGETMRCRPTDWWCSKVIRCLPLSALRADVEPLQPWYHSIWTANQAVQGQYFGAGLATYLARMKSDSVEAALWRCTRGVRSGACQPVQLGSRHWPLQLDWMNSLGTSSELKSLGKICVDGQQSIVLVHWFLNHFSELYTVANTRTSIQHTGGTRFV